VVYGEIRNDLSMVLRDFGIHPLQDFVPTVWELMPWSFLVDYFSNVGDVLSGCFVDFGGLLRMSVSTRNQALYKYKFGEFKLSGFGNATEVYGSHPEVIVGSKEVARQTPFPINAPRLQFNMQHSPLKWANMVALAAQRYVGLTHQTMRY
jgi:hypothetical protein